MVAWAPTVSDSAVFARLMETIENKKLPVVELGSLQAFSNGNGLLLEGLSPLPDAPPCKISDPDCNDLVLRLSYKQVSFLFTADIDTGIEKMLVNNRARLGSTVLKAGHHGSSTSSSAEFLAVVNPAAAAISVGKDNSYGHPDPSVLERIRKQIETGNIYLTSESGTIEFISDGEKLWVMTGKD
jgi:competence protein ComEC